MGSFMGHIIPGMYSLLFSTWWCFSQLLAYYRDRYKLGPKFCNSVTFPCGFTAACMKPCYLEGIIKIVSGIIGIIGELATGFDSTGTFKYIGNAQHSTMFAFFSISGAVDVIMTRPVPLPPQTQYCFFILFYAVEAILFNFHLHTHHALDVMLHKLLIYTVYGCIVALMLEMRWPTSLLAGLSRSFFTALHGTWFIQLGFILYPPLNAMKKWNEKDPENMIRASLLFVWHAFFVFLFIMLMAVTVNRCVGNGAALINDYELLRRDLERDDNRPLIEEENDIAK